MLVQERRPSCRTIERWAIQLLLEAGAIKKCHHHGYMQCRGDPEARMAAFNAAREEPPAGLSADDAVATLRDLLGGMGDTCPEC